MTFQVVIKQLKLNILRLFLSGIYWKKGNNCCFTDRKKNLNVGILSNVCEWIWFKVGKIVDAIVLYILIQFDWDSRSQESGEKNENTSPKFFLHEAEDKSWNHFYLFNGVY